MDIKVHLRVANSCLKKRLNLISNSLQMKLKSLIGLLIIIISLIPLYAVMNYLQKVMRPKESIRKFIFWLLTVLALIFIYTFLIVFVIKLLFPEA